MTRRIELTRERLLATHNVNLNESEISQILEDQDKAKISDSMDGINISLEQMELYEKYKEIIEFMNKRIEDLKHEDETNYCLASSELNNYTRELHKTENYEQMIIAELEKIQRCEKTDFN